MSNLSLCPVIQLATRQASTLVESNVKLVKMIHDANCAKLCFPGRQLRFHVSAQHIICDHVWQSVFGENVCKRVR